jgi:RIP metalloprotease RseP
VAVDGKEIPPARLRDIIRGAPSGKILELGVFRSGWMFFRPSRRFPVRARIDSRGTVPGLILTYRREPVLIKYRGWQAVTKGTEMMVDKTRKMFQFFYFLLAGRVGTSELAGPIGIFTITSAVEKFSQMLTLLAIISLNLGIINLFPIPVLDGGHLLIFSLEGILRRPLSPRLVSIAQQTGLFLLLALFVLVTYNDTVHRLMGY